MQNILVVTDMQYDFIDGPLGTAEAVAIVPHVRNRIQEFKGTVLYTRDTHDNNYLETQEGKKLPIAHCLKGSKGWQIHEELDALRTTRVIDKTSFGSNELRDRIIRLNKKERIRSITFVGLCTDICVLSNAMILKAALPEVPIIVDARCCAGTTPENHNNALSAMEVCQIEIIRPKKTKAERDAAAKAAGIEMGKEMALAGTAIAAKGGKTLAKMALPIVAKKAKKVVKNKKAQKIAKAAAVGALGLASKGIKNQKLKKAVGVAVKIGKHL